MTLDPKYVDNWRLVQPDCMLCEMDKRTDWYIETMDWIVAEKTTGGPFIVFKTHKDELTEDEWSDMERIVDLVFDSYDIRVMMDVVTDHWHGHILTNDEPKLSIQ